LGKFSRLISKYFPFFLAYLFWSLVVLGLGTGMSFYGEGDKRFWDKSASAKFHELTPETQLKFEREMLYRLSMEWLGKGWYYPFVLTLITVCIAESWPTKEELAESKLLRSKSN
jgi:hypothetical protein